MAFQDRLSVDRRNKMKELTKLEERNIFAGGGVTSSLLNTFMKGFDFFTDLGRYFGSSIRRMIGHNICDF